MKFLPRISIRKNVFQYFVAAQVASSLIAAPAFALWGFGEKNKLPERTLPTVGGYGAPSVSQTDRDSFNNSDSSLNRKDRSTWSSSTPPPAKATSFGAGSTLTLPQPVTESTAHWDGRLLFDVNDTTYIWAPVQEVADLNQRSAYVQSLMTVEAIVPKPLFADIFDVKAKDLNLATLVDTRQWKVMGFRVLPCVQQKPPRIQSPAAGMAKKIGAAAGSTTTSDGGAPAPSTPYRYIKNCTQYASIVAQPVMNDYATGKPVNTNDRVELFYRFEGATDSDYAFENLLGDLQQTKLAVENHDRLTTDGLALGVHPTLSPSSGAYNTANNNLQTLLKRHLSASRLEYVNVTVSVHGDVEAAGMSPEELRAYYSYLPTWTSISPEKRPSHIEFLTWKITNQGPERDYHATYFQSGHKVRYVVTETRSCEKKKDETVPATTGAASVGGSTTKYSAADCAPPETFKPLAQARHSGSSKVTGLAASVIVPSPAAQAAAQKMADNSGQPTAAANGGTEEKSAPEPAPKVYITYEVSLPKEETNFFIERPHSYGSRIVQEFQEAQFLKDNLGTHDSTNPQVVYSQIMRSTLFEKPSKMPKGITGFSSVLPRTSNSFRLWGVYNGHIEATAPTALYAAAAADYINDIFMGPYTSGPGDDCSSPSAINSVSLCFSMQKRNCEKLCKKFQTVKDQIQAQAAAAAQAEINNRPPQSAQPVQQQYQQQQSQKYMASERRSPLQQMQQQPSRNQDIVMRSRARFNDNTVSRYFSCEPRGGQVAAIYGYLNLDSSGRVESVDAAARVRDRSGFSRRVDIRSSNISSSTSFAASASGMLSVIFTQPGSGQQSRIEMTPKVTTVNSEKARRQTDVFADTLVAGQGSKAIQNKTHAIRTGQWTSRVIFSEPGSPSGFNLSTKSNGLECDFDERVF